MKKNIMLIGLGPHAKRIYIKLLKKHRIIPKLIVDLKSKQEEITDYLKSNFDQDINCYFIKDKEFLIDKLS